MTVQDQAPSPELSFWLDPAEMSQRAAELAPLYQSATPWPHLVCTDLLPTDLLERVREECAGVSHSTDMRATQNRQQIKHEIGDLSQLGTHTRHLLGQLDSAPFLDFLEQVTGIRGLISDPHHYLGGLHETPQGGYGTVHNDFAYYPRLDLYHRINVLVYLNPGWDETYGGQLELWTTDRKRVDKVVNPSFGTVVIFATGPNTYHGLPTPIAGPPGTVRRSLAAYYYTAQAPRSARRGLRGAVRVAGDDWRVGVPTLTEFAHFVMPRKARVAVNRTRQRLNSRKGD